MSKKNKVAYLPTSLDPDILAAEIRTFEDRRQRMLADGKLSLQAAVGRLVIVVSGASNKERWNPDDYRSFMEEAERVQYERKRLRQYAEVSISERAHSEDILNLFAEPEVSGLVLIGHGTIERLYTDGGTRRDVDWSGAAKAATHLKQGQIEQGICGHFPGYSSYCIPFGTFVVARLSNVRAAVGQILPDEPLNYEQILKPVFDDQRPVKEQLDTLNEAHLGRAVRVDTNGNRTDR